MNNFLLLLALLFIALKLMGFILWSWWWVLSPLLIIVAFLIAFAVFALITTKKILREVKKRKRKKVDSSEKDIFLKKFSEYEIEAGEIPSEYWADREFVLEAVKHNVEALQYASDELKNDPEFLEIIAKFNQ